MTTLEKLLVLQDRDRKLRQLLQETRDIPARKQLIESRLKANRDAHTLAQENLKKNAAQIKSIELEIDSVKETIKKYRAQQGQIKSNDQYRALEREIREQMGRIRELEEREIALMEESEPLKTVVTEREQALQLDEASVETDIKALDERFKHIQTEVEEARKNREGLTEGIDPSWLSRYTRIFNNKGDYALVPVENGTCGGCHMKVPPQLVQDAKRGDTMVSCSYCGRLLYWQP
ncbi:MAG TPA: C4-type zinc ribbon domain-containing protein [Kiritimatiellia bacterium]|nr:C4-type zinc ribbon domain-containing protein [Kiritimatiellia bacterium]HMO97900.1 C4-type zinc ribbon domain-containing protein [Kiritimatiellia bacterium]HMP95580.1 C4-type zinc ribbon domain-containing protein [Kiritimatiellia bacterium]